MIAVVHPRFRHLAWAISIAVGVCSLGCAGWPFRHKDRTPVITPPMRMATIREIGARAQDADQAQQQQMCQQLADQIRAEPDPLIRLTIQESISRFRTPLADAVLKAGLRDDDREVRLVCCKLLADRGSDAVADLNLLAATESDLDVRLAAVDALGKIKSPSGLSGLSAALNDRDPALQYAAVAAMKSATGEDLGNDVNAWRQYAAQHVPQQGAANVARQNDATTVK